MDFKNRQPGEVLWCDLTIPNAGKVREFYRAVVGWDVAELDMGGYSDYCMATPHDGVTVAGVCHKRGVNHDLPAQWLIYVKVSDLQKSMAEAKRSGGTVVAGPKPMGEGQYCVVKDPGGAVMALVQT